MKTTAGIQLDLSQPNFGAHVAAVQSDGNTRTVQAVLLDSGTPWHIPGGITAAVVYRKPDCTKGMYNKLPDGSPAVTLNNSVATIVLARQMLTVPGSLCQYCL